MRYALGGLLFGGFVVFVTPTELAVVISMADGSGDPAGLLCFGVGAAVLFGVPGYFAFPHERRLQAAAWLSLACLGYGLVIFGALTVAKMYPQFLHTPGNREFVQKLTIHYERLAAISLLQFAAWAALFRKRRPRVRKLADAEPIVAPDRRPH